MDGELSLLDNWFSVSRLIRLSCIERFIDVYKLILSGSEGIKKQRETIQSSPGPPFPKTHPKPQSPPAPYPNGSLSS
ncbi:unnamed protein product [Sphenostylis stenocarpa]|uniref:Uncharacterized protein n=1 Tax=Sphenostylis stenocarpa TaxID=92480 RepID=A0AA86SGK9_9FABA|nr:unnamed protein product [Sphenostylis stenocarpa]